MNFILIFLGIITIPTIGLIIFLSWLAFKARKEKNKNQDKEKSDKDLWWDYFKPYFAIPLSWILFQVILIIAFPMQAKWILNNYLGYIIGLQLLLINLNAFLGKKVDFINNPARKIMVALNTILIICVAIMIIGRIFWWPFQDYKNYFQFQASTVTQAMHDIKKANTEHKTKNLKQELFELKEKSEKEQLTQQEIMRAKEIQKQLIKIYSDTTEKQNQAKTEQQIETTKPKTKPTFFVNMSNSGIITIPAGQRIIVRNSNGQILHLKKGNYVHLEIVKGKYWKMAFVDDSGPKLKLKPMPKQKAKIKITSIATSDQLVLQNTGKEEIKLKIKIS